MTVVERHDFALDAVDAFRRLAHLPHVAYFDSALRGGPTGRYSFVVADPIVWTEVAAGDVFPEIERYVARSTAEYRPELPPFQGGVVGMFGYELAGAIERVPAAAIADIGTPGAAAYGWYDVVIAFDHRANATWIISQGWPETDPAARRERAAKRAREIRELLSGLRATSSLAAVEEFRIPGDELAPQYATGIDGVTSNFSGAKYEQAVRRAIEYIHAGDVFQVNLAQRLLHRANGSPVETYCRLRERNPAPMAGYLDGGGWQILSASPERFLKVDRRQVETRPIKGTTERTTDAAANRASGARLAASAKDRAENLMIVDLLRNDLSRACRSDSVRVTQLCGLEEYAWVQHLVSVVEGTLRDGETPLGLLRHAFPGGSITGAPKIRAMEIIAELEPTVRGPYCGSLGYIGVGGQMDTSILIRTITAARGWWQIPVGGGIVADSDPRREYEETWQKAKGMIEAIG